MPIVYGINKFGLCFATMASLFVWLFLEKHHEIRTAICDSWTHITKRKRPSSPIDTSSTPTWWYACAAAIAAALAIFACEFYPVQLRWYGALFALFISFVFFVPVSFPFPFTPALQQPQFQSNDDPQLTPHHLPARLDLRNRKRQGPNRNPLPHHRRLPLRRQSPRKHLVL